MRFLVDTNVVSELRNPARTNPNVRRWAESVEGTDTAISAIVLIELQSGALRVRVSNPGLHVALLRWINDDVRPRYDGRILPVDELVALRCAQLSHPRTPPLNDALIAATALEHDLTIVTRNIADFEPMDVRLLNPWDP
jgi:predicted nucleic acid-binding protein